MGIIWIERNRLIVILNGALILLECIIRITLEVI